LEVGMAEILEVFPKVLQIRSFAGLDAEQATQMAIISLQSLMGDLLREICFLIWVETRLSCRFDWGPSLTCPCQAAWNVSCRSPLSFLQ
jgi:hypothetical protein